MTLASLLLKDASKFDLELLLKIEIELKLSFFSAKFEVVVEFFLEANSVCLVELLLMRVCWISFEIFILF